MKPALGRIVSNAATSTGKQTTADKPQRLGLSERSDGMVGIIANKLKFFRNAIGLTQIEMGRLMGGISFQQIQKYESGKNCVPLDRLFMVTDKYGLSIDFFLSEHSYNLNDFAKNVSTDHLGCNYGNDIINLADKLYNMSEYKKNALMVLCDVQKPPRS